MAITAVLIYDVIGGEDPPWTTGPLAIQVPEWMLRQGWATSNRTDLEARSAYFDQGVLGVLYGTLGQPCRWFQTVEDDLGAAAVWATEVLRLSPDYGNQALLVVHVSLDEEPIEVLQQLTRINGGDSGLINKLSTLLPHGWAISPLQRRATSLALAGKPSTPEMDHELHLWTLASATTLRAFNPSRQDLDSASRIDFSADWSGYVLRDGVGFCTWGADHEIDELAHTLVHTLYLDTILLVRLQLQAVRSITVELADRSLSDGQARDLIRLERQMFDFRRRIWWTHVGSRGNANMLLAAYQAAHDLPERQRALASDVGDAARLAQSIASARSSAALGVISLVGVPLAVAFAGAALLPSHGWLVLLAATFIGLALSISLVWFTPLKELIRGWRSE